MNSSNKFDNNDDKSFKKALQTASNPNFQINQKKKNTRRRHRNSHLGCGTCKKRRIKCDENLPLCLNCLKGKLHCAYLNLDPTARNALRMAQYNQNVRGDRPGDDDQPITNPVSSTTGPVPNPSAPIPNPSPGNLQPIVAASHPTGGHMTATSPNISPNMLSGQPSPHNSAPVSSQHTPNSTTSSIQGHSPNPQPQQPPGTIILSPYGPYVPVQTYPGNMVYPNVAGASMPVPSVVPMPVPYYQPGQPPPPPQQSQQPQPPIPQTVVHPAPQQTPPHPSDPLPVPNILPQPRTSVSSSSSSSLPVRSSSISAPSRRPTQELVSGPSSDTTSASGSTSVSASSSAPASAIAPAIKVSPGSKSPGVPTSEPAAHASTTPGSTNTSGSESASPRLPRQASFNTLSQLDDQSLGVPKIPTSSSTSSLVNAQTKVKSESPDEVKLPPIKLLNVNESDNEKEKKVPSISKLLS